MKFAFFRLDGKILSNNLNNCIYDLSFIRKMDKKCLELFFNKRGIEIKKVINNQKSNLKERKEKFLVLVDKILFSEV